LDSARHVVPIIDSACWIAAHENQKEKNR
jgi:hypothetical protein